MTPKTKKFEDELKDLETIVSQIDSGELTLEESISAFERGVMLVKALNGKLDEVERKVELLTRSAGGELRTAPFQASSDDEHPAGAKDDDEPPFKQWSRREAQAADAPLIGAARALQA